MALLVPFRFVKGREFMPPLPKWLQLMVAYPWVQVPQYEVSTQNRIFDSWTETLLTCPSSLSLVLMMIVMLCCLLLLLIIMFMFLVVFVIGMIVLCSFIPLLLFSLLLVFLGPRLLLVLVLLVYGCPTGTTISCPLVIILSDS